MIARKAMGIASVVNVRKSAGGGGKTVERIGQGCGGKVK